MIIYLVTHLNQCPHPKINFFGRHCHFYSTLNESMKITPTICASFSCYCEFRTDTYGVTSHQAVVVAPLDLR